MKLYLSSLGLGDQAARLQALARPNGRAGVVLNAGDAEDSSRKAARRHEFRELARLGFSCDEIDLREYFSDNAGLADRLADYDLIWVAGGNSFVLARAMTQSGFDRAASARVASNALVYAGYSAGACVAGPDLDGCQLIDEPDELPRGYDPDVPTRTLGWVPWRIVPHFRSGHAESDAAEHAAKHLETAGLEHRVLRDGEVIVVESPSAS
jgi:dipeptidase E